MGTIGIISFTNDDDTIYHKKYFQEMVSQRRYAPNGQNALKSPANVKFQYCFLIHIYGESEIYTK